MLTERIDFDEFGRVIRIANPAAEDEAYESFVEEDWEQDRR